MRTWQVTRTLAVTAVATVALGGTASAALGPQGVRAGKNVTVFHNIDFVAAFGHQLGQPVQVDLLRDGRRIASSRGPAASTPEGGALEVNHGVAGAAGPGDCWEGATPDVRPGELVRVTSAGGVDEVIVDDLTIDGMTREPGPTAGPDDDQVWVRGVARTAAGEALPIAQLDSGEFRDPLNGQLRMEPNEVVAGADAGTYIAKYYAPFRFVKGSTTTSLALDALMRDGHAFGYGHLPLPDGSLRPDAMLVDGQGETPGPAIGCEASAAAPSSVGALSAPALNGAALAPLADGDTALTVGGWAAADVGAAQVQVTDGAGTTITKDVAGLAGGATGPQGWDATVTKGELAGLQQGALTVQLRVGGAPAGAARTLHYDTVAPSFSVSPAGGTYTGTQRVTVTGDEVTYVLDGSAFPRSYAGVPIELEPGAHTLVLRSEDAAGNVTTQTHTYDIRPGAQPAQPAAAAGAAPPPPAPVVVLGPAPASLAPAAPRSLDATLLGTRQRIGRAQARRSGVTARFRAPAGSRTAVVTVSRMAGDELRLVGTKRVRVRAGANTVKLNAAKLRRKLTPGLYYLEVVVRDARGRAGEPAAGFVRVLR